MDNTDHTVRSVYSGPHHVAVIRKQNPSADGYKPWAPWRLLHNHGTVGTFSSYAYAREVALQSYGNARIKRGA